MKVWGRTDVGRVREENQDNFYCEVTKDDNAIICVCDGMGGAAGGNIASQFAAKEFVLEVKRLLTCEMNDEIAKNILVSATSHANNFVYDKSQLDENLKDMGTTLVGGFVSGNVLYLANIGDSRCYHIDAHDINRVTKDHSLIQQLLDLGHISIGESQLHPQKNVITRAVGIGDSVDADIYKIILEQGESVVLCSDGLYNLACENDIKIIVNSFDSLAEKCDRLVDLANNNGGFDNVTAVILQF